MTEAPRVSTCPHEPGNVHALGATITLLGSLLILAFIAFFVAVGAGWIR